MFNYYYNCLFDVLIGIFFSLGRSRVFFLLIKYVRWKKKVANFRQNNLHRNILSDVNTFSYDIIEYYFASTVCSHWKLSLRIICRNILTEHSVFHTWSFQRFERFWTWLNTFEKNDFTLVSKKKKMNVNSYLISRHSIYSFFFFSLFSYFDLRLRQLSSIYFYAHCAADHPQRTSLFRRSTTF